jgi:glutaredoxin
LNKIILYTTHCPKCKILTEKLDSKNITYEICSDVKTMVAKGFRSAPILEVDNEVFTYLDAINWIKERN